MLYSPLLSLSKFIVLIPWILIISFFHMIASLISRKFFFFFFKILFQGLIKILGIKLKITGLPHKKKTLFISNHISYLDIIILGSQTNAIFVAKSEIKKWPLINKLSAIAKTIFVERKNIRAVKDQMSLIKKSFKDGFNVILFPEGTSSDGSKVLKFKSSLFALVDFEDLQDFDIQPISISYNKLDGIPLDKSYRPFLAWFGAMDLFSHAWKFLGLGMSEVNVRFHSARKFSSFSNRKNACSFCFEKISNQVIKDYRSLEIDDKIKLYEFKFL